MESEQKFWELTVCNKPTGSNDREFHMSCEKTWWPVSCREMLVKCWYDPSLLMPSTYFVMEHLKEVDSQSSDVIGPNNFEHNRGCDHLVNVDYTGL
jgi:hypothetical protein